MEVRVATPNDLEGVVDTLTFAFSTDPIWQWAFPEPEMQRAWWQLFAGSAIRRYRWSFVAGDYAAVSVWLPPGGSELDEEEEAGVRPLVDRLAGNRADQVWQLLEAFDDNHPAGPPHFYLSLLGVAEGQRGKGLGMKLLAENLARIDAEGVPSHLESSNSRNNVRYERQGFRETGRFQRPDRGAEVTTMWRDAPAVPVSPG